MSAAGYTPKSPDLSALSSDPKLSCLLKAPAPKWTSKREEYVPPPAIWPLGTPNATVFAESPAMDTTSRGGLLNGASGDKAVRKQTCEPATNNPAQVSPQVWQTGKRKATDDIPDRRNRRIQTADVANSVEASSSSLPLPRSFGSMRFRESGQPLHPIPSFTNHNAPKQQPVAVPSSGHDSNPENRGRDETVGKPLLAALSRMDDASSDSQEERVLMAMEEQGDEEGDEKGDEEDDDEDEKNENRESSEEDEDEEDEEKDDVEDEEDEEKVEVEDKVEEDVDGGDGDGDEEDEGDEDKNEDESEGEHDEKDDEDEEDEDRGEKDEDEEDYANLSRAVVTPVTAIDDDYVKRDKC